MRPKSDQTCCPNWISLGAEKGWAICTSSGDAHHRSRLGGMACSAEIGSGWLPKSDQVRCPDRMSFVAQIGSGWLPKSAQPCSRVGSPPLAKTDQGRCRHCVTFVIQGRSFFHHIGYCFPATGLHSRVEQSWRKRKRATSQILKLGWKRAPGRVTPARTNASRMCLPKIIPGLLLWKGDAHPCIPEFGNL